MPLFLEDTVADTRKQIRVGERTLNVTVPAGTGDNERIRLKGQGAPAPMAAPPAISICACGWCPIPCSTWRATT